MSKFSNDTSLDHIGYNPLDPANASKLPIDQSQSFLKVPKRLQCQVDCTHRHIKNVDRAFPREVADNRVKRGTHLASTNFDFGSESIQGRSNKIF